MRIRREMFDVIMVGIVLLFFFFSVQAITKNIAKNQKERTFPLEGLSFYIKVEGNCNSKNVNFLTQENLRDGGVIATSEKKANLVFVLKDGNVTGFYESSVFVTWDKSQVRQNLSDILLSDYRFQRGNQN